MESLFDKERLIDFWIECSNDDFETMLVMYDSGRYSWALFIGHIVIEKLLKAYYIKKHGQHPPYIHNLLRLAVLNGFDINERLKNQLVTITAFNINARYDDYKRSFQMISTPDYTGKWMLIIKELRLWIIEQIKE